MSDTKSRWLERIIFTACVGLLTTLLLADRADYRAELKDKVSHRELDKLESTIKERLVSISGKIDSNTTKLDKIIEKVFSK